MLTKHQSHSHFGFISDSNPSPSDQNPIFPVQNQANPNSHFIPSGPSLQKLHSKFHHVNFIKLGTPLSLQNILGMLSYF